ncbi:hypothetical protein ACFS7Z_26605 [Pontibacter toksunensis]|uniref:Uncharacterized protein n=1 Tax=Pontibacter toksunensis TaxID=1332631 RepID=A0ABW6C4K4_9BACT
MKKVTFLAAAIALVGMSSFEANAQTTTSQEQAPAAQQGQEEQKEKVTLE